MWKPWENESETQRIRRQKERYRDDKRWQIIDERKNDPMGRLHTRHRKKLMICGACVFLAMLLLIGRLGYVMIFQAQYYLSRAEELHERERVIKASRGRILDTNGIVLADNKTVCTISVIHSQIQDAEAVIHMLTSELGLDEAQVRKRVEKVSSIERIQTNVSKETGDKIREYNMAGVKVDEDYKRYYPYETLASRVLGFTGSDNCLLYTSDAADDS